MVSWEDAFPWFIFFPPFCGGGQFSFAIWGHFSIGDDSGYIPFFVEARKRSEAALMNVIQEAYVNGVSTSPNKRGAKHWLPFCCAGLSARAFSACQFL
jgi:hypothetical protein